MLFHFDAVARHCNTLHQMTLKTYRTEYVAVTGQSESNLTKKTSSEKMKRKRVNELEPGLAEKWRTTVDGTRKYLSDNMNEMCLRSFFV